MPAKGDTVEPRARRGSAPRFRRPAADIVQRAARRVVRGGKASFPSQAAFRAALIAQMRRDEPLATIGGGRLRRLLIGVAGVRIQVHYTERHDLRPLERCPVCGAELQPIHNRTLTGGTVAIGQRCRRCEYWTHAARRVPVRYTFSQAGIDGHAVRRAPGP